MTDEIEQEIKDRKDFMIQIFHKQGCPTIEECLEEFEKAIRKDQTEKIINYIRDLPFASYKITELLLELRQLLRKEFLGVVTKCSHTLNSKGVYSDEK